MALASSFFVNLPVVVTGACLVVLAVVRLFRMVHARQAEHLSALVVDEAPSAADEERMRVAGILHDGPIQQLTALALTLDLMTIQLDRGDLSALKSTVAQARLTATDQMVALRRLMRELRAPALDETGPAAAPHGRISEPVAEAA